MVPSGTQGWPQPGQPRAPDFELAIAKVDITAAVL
jgi:hypothetical protein